MSQTKLYRNSKGILGVERDGVLLFGPSKALRGSDVTVEVVDEHWVALQDVKWNKRADATLTNALGALRIESVLGGKAAVFSAVSTVTEANLQSLISGYIEPVILADDSILVDTQTFPSVVQAGSVNVGGAKRTGMFVRGLQVWRRTVAGYLPDKDKYVTTINGSSNALIFYVDGADGMIVDYKAYAVTTSNTARLYRVNFPDSPEQAIYGPIIAVSFSMFGGSTNRLFVLLMNRWPTTLLNGRKFFMMIDYIDPGAPT